MWGWSKLLKGEIESLKRLKMLLWFKEKCNGKALIIAKHI